MSTDSGLLIASKPTAQVGQLKVPFALENADCPWDIERLVGILQTNAAREDTSTHGEPWIKVAPEYYVKKSEYQRRFGEIDLEYYRQRMSPELFTAFVRHMGVVPGSPGLDVVELTALPDF